MCMFVGVCVRERERECVNVYMRVFARINLYTCVYVVYLKCVVNTNIRVCVFVPCWYCGNTFARAESGI